MIPEYYFFDTFRGKRVHLGVTGSIAAFKALDLLRALVQLHIQVGVTLTDGARKFVTDLCFGALGADPVHGDLFTTGMEYDHLEPCVADAFLVAPATANILAKMAHGIADNLLSCQLLAYAGPMLVAPAMNPRMWAAAATQENWRTLLQRGVWPLTPCTGKVACGDEGAGRMAEVHEIFFHVLTALTPQDLAGQRIMLTLGPTREYFDQARFWSNPSTGRMGASLAVCAAMRGAEVTVIQGPVDLVLPSCVTVVPVISAREMFAAAQDIFPAQDIGCFTAAVADFRPPVCAQGKFKKTGTGLHLDFDANPDILATLSAEKKSGQLTIGFAAEVENLAEYAVQKLDRKNLDVLVANPIHEPGAGFASPTNRVLVFDRHGRHEAWPVLPKTEVAWRIWDWILPSIG
ncbi:bifunctional phosphopantothenoylcysteine decarboxylase/phosphopantothenate--cysteine ligase CoaBC [Desulfovibrionales bacterium]